ncbi:MAG: phosphoribosyltransferase family protein [Candidatus Pacebacteria bacterium]|nr:phosphoribosyltransferase family protein [Candidatus Paceibacterota bacterium]
MFHFFDFLFPPRADERIVRDVSVDDMLALEVPRLVPATRPLTVGLLPFSSTSVRSAIHEAKYHGSEHAFTLLSSALADYLRDCDDVGPRRSYISLVPVPLGRERRKERGFNQVQEIAQRAARELDIRVDATLLVRVRETVSQVSLPREAREENMRGAFSAAHPADPAHTYIVIDDVITTGATLQAAVDALKEAGAEHIIPLALAY